MKKERVRINLDVSKELGEKIKAQAEAEDKAVNVLIREILDQYLKNKAV